jgi:predicted ATPase
MKLITLGGTEETGKTTLYETLERREGEKYHYIPDNVKRLITEHPTAVSDVYVMQEVFKEAIAEYIVGVQNARGRTVISDTGLIDLAAKAQFVLETQDFVWLNRYMKDFEKHDQLYIKLPVHVVPTEIEDGVQYNLHHRIDRTLRKNPKTQVSRVPQTLHSFQRRYYHVLSLIERFGA